MQVKIEKYDDLGNGLLRLENKVCFVKRALPEELVDIKIKKEKKNYMEAEIIDIVLESKKRCVPFCKFYDKCGGCQFLHTKKEEENKFKIEKFQNYFGFCDDFLKTKDDHYRNKVTLHIKDGKLGFYEEKTNELVEIDYCYLLLPKINEVIKILKKYQDSNFNGKVIIRSNINSEIMVIVDGNYNFINELKEKDIVDHLIYNHKVLKGNSYFIEHVLSYQFKVSYPSFFQVNHEGLIKIYQVLTSFLESHEIKTALDLYSGTSVLGIHLSKYVYKVISIEANRFATNDAEENLKLNHIENLEVITGLVEDHIDKFKNIDLIVVDPARSGLDKKTITYLKKIKPKYLIYIACGIDALKRDLKELDEVYEKEKMYALDMFPRTNHIESIGILKLK